MWNIHKKLNDRNTLRVIEVNNHYKAEEILAAVFTGKLLNNSMDNPSHICRFRFVSWLEFSLIACCECHNMSCWLKMETGKPRSGEWARDCQLETCECIRKWNPISLKGKCWNKESCSGLFLKTKEKLLKAGISNRNQAHVLGSSIQFFLLFWLLWTNPILFEERDR